MPTIISTLRETGGSRRCAVASCDALKLEDKAAAFARYLIWGGMQLAVLEQDDRKRARYLQSTLLGSLSQRHSVLRNVLGRLVMLDDAHQACHGLP